MRILTIAAGALLLLGAPAAQASKPVVCSGPGDREWTVKGRTISTQLRAEKAVGRMTNEKQLPDGRQWRVKFVGGDATFTRTGGNYVLAFDNGVVTRGTCAQRR